MEKKKYTYSGYERDVNPAGKNLRQMFPTVNKTVQSLYENHPKFSVVISQFYRNGNDTIGVHSDDEKNIRENTCIASVSFGAERYFSIYEKLPGNKRKLVKKILLENGSMFIMGPGFQKLYSHAITKSAKITTGRQNFTFRCYTDDSLEVKTDESVSVESDEDSSEDSENKVELMKTYLTMNLRIVR